jgi:predicted nucleic acid-binding protein
MNKVLVDTSILVPIYDLSNPTKQERSIATVDRLIASARAVITPQILGEFMTATTHPERPLMTSVEAAASIHHYMESCSIVDITRLVTLEAIRGVNTHNFRFWSAQVWATARLNQIPEIYSEEFQNGTVIEGVGFVNPFIEYFP